MSGLDLNVKLQIWYAHVIPVRQAKLADTPKLPSTHSTPRPTPDRRFGDHVDLVGPLPPRLHISVHHHRHVHQMARSSANPKR